MYSAFFVAGSSAIFRLVEVDLVPERRRLALDELLAARRDELADAVVDVASSPADMPRAPRSFSVASLSSIDLAALDALRLDVGEDRIHVGIADHELRRLELERIAHPREAGDLEQQSDLLLVRALEHRRLRVEAEQLRGPPEVGLEDLSDVHAARHAERVEHDVDRLAVGEERHVLLGDDAGNDTLVAVASGHLVADRDLALLGQIDLHELDDARGQLIRLQDAVDALFRLLLELRLLVVGGVDDRADLARSPSCRRRGRS